MNMASEDQPAPSPGKILFVAEAVTLAHVARPLAVYRSLPEEGWLSTIACDPRAKRFLDGFGRRVVPLASIEPERFLQALRRGKPLYDDPTLRNYVEADLEVIGRVKPDLIIGDFRLSLSVSARLAGVPYATISNAYWSPYYRPGSWPVPELPLTHGLPLPLARLLFRCARSAAFALHTRPLNRVRKQFGLPSLGSDLRRVYTDADFVLYADLPELFPLNGLPANHRFIGPTLWEPATPFPAAWQTLTGDRRLVYVTMGSSGNPALLPSIISALSALSVTAMVATAGLAHLRESAPNVLVADMLPGIEAARRSALVVCNGGSLACYQALSAGVPVIGIASNLDQFLNMQALERTGAGLTLRADRFNGRLLQDAADRILRDEAFRDRAQQVKRWTQQHSLADGIRTFLGEVSGRVAPRPVRR
jgi:UDP:flavonoid glycosyltransferase YjiC (YdhE family)